LAAYQVNQGKLTIGDLVAINAYILQLYQPLGWLGTSYRMIVSSFTDMEKLFELLNENPDVKDEEDAPQLRIAPGGGEIKFDHVSFVYPSRNVGDKAAGKTTFARRYATGIFREDYKSTIGVDFFEKEFIADKIRVRLQLWDISSDERFGSSTRIYYKDAKAALIMYDVNNCNFDTQIQKWKLDIQLKAPENIPIFLIANKMDLLREKRMPLEDLKTMVRYCSRNKFRDFFETSAKLSIGGNVEESMRAISLSIIADLASNTAVERAGSGSAKRVGIIKLNDPIKPSPNCCNII